MATDLSKYSKGDYKVGKNKIVQILWYFTNVFVFKSSVLPFMGLKRFLLKLFGAKIGKNVVIKPCVNIKYPWRLSVGDYTWIGENVWIDNLADVVIGKNCCLSQGVMLETGSHSYNDSQFTLITSPINIADGAWICAKAIVLGGSNVDNQAIIAAGSVFSGYAKPYFIYKGNPAVEVKERKK